MSKICNENKRGNILAQRWDGKTSLPWLLTPQGRQWSLFCLGIDVKHHNPKQKSLKKHKAAEGLAQRQLEQEIHLWESTISYPSRKLNEGVLLLWPLRWACTGRKIFLFFPRPIKIVSAPKSQTVSGSLEIFGILWNGIYRKTTQGIPVGKLWHDSPESMGVSISPYVQ